MKVLTELQKIESRRSTWQATKPTTIARTQCPDTLRRVLALRHLELDVQEWTVTYLASLGMDSSELTGIRAILESHAQDETKHDQQLAWLSDYWGLQDYDLASEGADELVARWRSNQSNPLAKKLVLEAMGLFQCMSLMQVTAPSDLFTQAVRQWIMFDEPAHVASARVLLQFSGIRINRELLQLGTDTVAWLCEYLPADQQKRFQRIAQGILKQGTAREADEISTASIPEFFTQQSNQNIPYTMVPDKVY